jgi:3',5'-nucleoside bisphosphate phosphatase
MLKTSTSDLILAANASIDLQLHTLYSDGVWTPEALIDHLVSEGFGLAAITDHDRADTAASLQQLAAEKGLPLLVAAEFTALWRGEMTDMLCYGFDPQDNFLDALGRDLLRRQQENIQGVYDTLSGQGYDFGDPQDLRTVLDKPSAQQPHAMVAFVKKCGYGNDIDGQSAGKILLGAGLEFATTEVAAVVDAAHRSGAVCLIAHPGRTDGFVTYDIDLLDQLRQEAPIDGFEVYYPAHSPEQTAMYLAYAQQHDLLTSSGSDSHGPDKKPIKYAADLSRKLLERLGIRVQ